MNNEDLIKKIKEYDFYHDIELKEGISTKSFKTKGELQYDINDLTHWSQKRNMAYIDDAKISFKNKRVLDIGCRDGLFSFEAEKRGASEVIGIDNNISKGAVEFLIPYFKSKVKMFQKNLYEITIKDFGKIDIILFFGVLYHLRYPFYALKVIKNLLKEDSILIIETAIYVDDNKRPFIYCPIGSESEFDKSCCSFFNVKALEDTLKSMGISIVRKEVRVQKRNFRVLKNIIRFVLRTIFRKDMVFGIKTKHFKKHDQDIGKIVGPVSRAFFICKLDNSLIDEEASNYWESYHRWHTPKTK